VSAWVCLMYHDVTADSAEPGQGKEYFSVSRSVFEHQLDQLAGLGRNVCNLETVVASPSPDGKRVIACTFDDGDAGQFDRGFPALAKRGMSATFFVTTDWVGKPGYVSWNGLREAKAAGMSIQSHTRSHPFLSELTAEELGNELAGSRAILDDQLGQQTTTLALPGGDPPRSALREQIAAAGYRIVANSRWGVNRARTSGSITWVNRCTIRGRMADDRFARVAQGDPWISATRQVREAVLRALRNSLGPTRYARWRRQLLQTSPHQEAT
jgi:peptidoglycan/xylan/chitin deacetylase (PgdA/CDA1 family)